MLHVQSCCFANLNLLLFTILIAVAVVKLPNALSPLPKCWRPKKLVTAYLRRLSHSAVISNQKNEIGLLLLIARTAVC